MKKLSSLSAKERAMKAAKLAAKLDKKSAANLGPGSKAVIDTGKEAIVEKQFQKERKKRGIPEEGAAAQRGWAWSKTHGKKPY